MKVARNHSAISQQSGHTPAKPLSCCACKWSNRARCCPSDAHKACSLVSFVLFGGVSNPAKIQLGKLLFGKHVGTWLYSCYRPWYSLIIPYYPLQYSFSLAQVAKKTIQDHSNISRPFKNIKDLKDPKGILRILQNQSQHTNKADEIWQRIWNTSIQWVKIRNRLLQIVKLHFFSRSLGWCGSRICFF